LNKFNSIEVIDLPTKHGPLDKVGESIAKMSKETTNNEKRFSCDVCKIKFRYRYQLDVHKSRHSGVKPFECESCGKQFYTQSELNSHKLVHTDERPHECRICGTKFKRQSNLFQHMRTHTFKHTHHLTRHLRFLSEERPFGCENANKHSKKYNLTIHMRSPYGRKTIKM
uniref:Protein krueppel n=1 Tax=Rodentolepis nana TaxID=102285 RepID=A0A0R3T1X1_RODNA